MPEPPLKDTVVDPEQKALDMLDDIRTHFNSELIPMVSDYQAFVQDLCDNKIKADTTTPKKLKDQHAKVSELLLQCLIKTDGITLTAETVRSKRKETVRFIQSQLDLVDSVKKKAEEKQRL
jgi:hypothetical protein